jgi:hypothetical protein
MNKLVVFSTAALATLLAASPGARAGTLDQEPPPDKDDAAIQSLQEGALLPQTAAAAHPYAGIVTASGGYDSARETALFDAIAEVKLFGPLSVRGGGTYLADDETMKPTIGLVLQFFDQRRHGVSASFGTFYKPEGLTEPEGEIEGVLAFSRVFDRTTAAVNLAYGQDPEGNERDGETRVALLYRLGSAFAGVDSRLRFAIGDPKNGEPKLDLIAGPLASYALGSYAATLQVGVSAVDVEDTTQTGAIGLAGLSRVF